MTDFTYKDYTPANARVLVDYTKPPQDRVKFAYPQRMSYKKALWKFGFQSFMSLISTTLAILGLFLLGLTAISIIIIHLIIFIEHPTLPSLSATSSATPHTLAMFVQFLFMAGIALFIVLGIPALLTWYYGRDKEKLSAMIPKLNYKISLIWNLFTKDYMCIRPKDIKGNTFILPKFSNVFLDYKTTGQMSSKLKKVKVAEHPPYRIKKSNGKLGKKRINHYRFMAIFEFESKPQTGCLEIEYI